MLLSDWKFGASPKDLFGNVLNIGWNNSGWFIFQHNQHGHFLAEKPKRVSLARAFALEPDVLFLDEPFSALDAPTKESLRLDLAQVFKATQTTTVLVSHDFKDIEHLTNRALILLNGQVVTEGSPSELLRSPQKEEVERFLAHFSS